MPVLASSIAAVRHDDVRGGRRFRLLVKGIGTQAGTAASWRERRRPEGSVGFIPPCLPVVRRTRQTVPGPLHVIEGELGKLLLTQRVPARYVDMPDPAPEQGIDWAVIGRAKFSALIPAAVESVAFVQDAVGIGRNTHLVGGIVVIGTVIVFVGRAEDDRGLRIADKGAASRQ